jgi:hypothetical protein
MTNPIIWIRFFGNFSMWTASHLDYSGVSVSGIKIPMKILGKEIVRHRLTVLIMN